MNLQWTRISVLLAIKIASKTLIQLALCLNPYLVPLEPLILIGTTKTSWLLPLPQELSVLSVRIGGNVSCSDHLF